MHVLLKHWSEGLGWEMVGSLFNIVQARTVVMLPLISLSLAMKTQG